MAAVEPVGAVVVECRDDIMRVVGVRERLGKVEVIGRGKATTAGGVV